MSEFESAGGRDLLAEQIEYYRARAAEYDDWFFRRGRYDRGPQHRTEWMRGIATLERWLKCRMPFGDVLEIAAGTGLWTRLLAEGSRRIVAVDASPEVLGISAKRLTSTSVNVEYRVADVFAWTPTTCYDTVFFAFWLSHVPRARFDWFWRLVGAALRPGGEAVFIDSLREASSTARDHELPADTGIVKRRLNDGREFDVVKIFYEARALEITLAQRGWVGSVGCTGKFFLYGAFRRPEPDQSRPGKRRRSSAMGGNVHAKVIMN